MARIETIRQVLTQISSCFPTFKKNDEVTDIIFDELFSVADETVICAIRRLVVTESYPPKVADIVGAVRKMAAEEANRCVRSDSDYIDYWDRSPAERAGIDAAKAEFRRVWQALERGVPVEELYPPDSEPCLLAAEMRRKRGEEAPKTIELAQNVLELDCKQAASGEREDTREMWGFDW